MKAISDATARMAAELLERYAATPYPRASTREANARRMARIVAGKLKNAKNIER